MTISTLLFLLCLFFLAVGSARWWWLVHDGILCYPDFMAGMCFLTALVLVDMYLLKPSQSHTLTSLISQYVFNKLVFVLGPILKMRLSWMCKRYKDQQEKLLKAILRQNRITSFAKSHGLDQVDSVEVFQKVMPLTTYNDYTEYAEVASDRGTENLMFPGKPCYIALTSGTSSGKSKAFPKYSKTRTKILPWLFVTQYLMMCYESSRFLLKWFFVKVKSKAILTGCGIESGSISNIYYKVNLPFTITPEINVFTEFDSLYIQLVFGLSENDTNCLSTMVSTTALSLFTILEQNWPAICDDIERGKLSDKLTIAKEEKLHLEKLLKPQSDRADFLRKEFSKGFQGIVPRLWQNCPCLFAIKTGVFESPAKIVERKYLGDLPCVTLLHLGTESIYGINLDPCVQPEVNFTAFIPGNFFEFIPEEDFEKQNPITLLGHQVRVGENYEMVITTFDGLYRYRLEDVIQITGFHGTTPVYKFLRRTGDILSVNMEKVPECLLHEAVYAAAVDWQKKIIQFTSCESIHLQKITGADMLQKCYIIFIELQNGFLVNDFDAKQVDEELCRRHDVYFTMRQREMIQSLQLIQMKSGAFNVVRQMMLAANPNLACMQYKLPRVMRREDIIECMLNMQLNVNCC